MKLRLAILQRGAATIEFYLVGFFVLLPLLMGILQTGMFMVAKNTLNLAAFAAARAGAAAEGDPKVMRQAIVTNLSPLYVAQGFKLLGSSGFKEIGAGNFTVVMPAAYGAASAAWSLSQNKLTVLNPTPASFKDFGIKDPNNSKEIIIPTTNILDDTKIGSNSKQTRADALLLKVELRYCYLMVFPIIDVLIAKLLSSTSTDIADQSCYSNLGGGRGIPIKSQAIVRMTTPARQINFTK